MELYQLTACEAGRALQKKEASAAELVAASLDRMALVESTINGFISLREERELFREAEKIQKLLDNGRQLSPLAGIPMALKDNLCTRDLPTTCGSKMLADYRPPYDAHVVDLLKGAHAIMIGKSNMDEFAMGSSTENSYFKPTLNPWDIERVPGGSSGGSAALVAAGEVFFAIGSDTGGSVRQPASLCGVVGLKPTYGLVSRYGLIAFASSLDQVGPLTRDVRDCAAVLDVIAGCDPRDSTSADRQKEHYSSYLGKEVKGFRVAFPSEQLGLGIEQYYKEVFLEGVGKLGRLGVEVEEISMPVYNYALPAYYIICPAEASSNLARYDGVQYGFRSGGEQDLLELYFKNRTEAFGPEVKRRIMLGTYALSAGYYDAYYLQASRVRTAVKQQLERIFEKYDFVVTPTSPTSAFKLGEKVDDPLTMYLNDIFTTLANLAGVPAISIPCGLANGLPVGLQLIGRHFDEGRMFQLCCALEEELGMKGVRPDIRTALEREDA